VLTTDPATESTTQDGPSRFLRHNGGGTRCEVASRLSHLDYDWQRQLWQHRQGFRKHRAAEPDETMLLVTTRLRVRQSGRRRKP
jgi:hypothetical protein